MDADFTGNWDPMEMEDPDTDILRHGYVIIYVGYILLKTITANGMCFILNIE